MLRYIALIAAALMATSPALAQQDPAADYPNRPVKIIVSVPAGGGVDTVTRIFAARLQQRLGQTFVIENRGCGGGTIARRRCIPPSPTATLCWRRSLRRSPAISRSIRS